MSQNHLKPLGHIFLVFVLGVVVVGCKDSSTGRDQTRKQDDPHAALGLKIATPPLDSQSAKLFEAIQVGSLQQAKAALEAGARIDARDSKNNTPLIAATLAERLEILDWLVKQGAPLEAVGGDGSTALLRAVAESKPAAAKLLIAAGANVDTQGRQDYFRATPLLVASGLGQVDLVKALVAAGANVNLANETGVTPLMDAAHGSEAMVRLLLEAGADPNLRDMDGNTALRIAQREEQPAIVRLLKQAGRSGTSQEKGQRMQKKNVPAKTGTPSGTES